ncbi:MAG: SUMF1/EgtB/PvdO family nonheme iron enzyme [Fuerstiella sp.]
MEFDRDWDDLPVAELHQLDAVCDRFEQLLAQDPATRIEPFIADLPEAQQRLVVLELVQLKVERQHVDGQVPTADDYARRFPQWAEELYSLVKLRVEDLDHASMAAAAPETVTQPSLADTWRSGMTERASLADEWRKSTSGRPLADLPADGVLGQYHLRSVIGRGGMGLVVRAHDTRLGRDVAIKVLASELFHDATAHERFLREAQAVAIIQHNNVVTIYGVEEIDGIPFLAMELVDGITLEHYLRDSEKPSPSEVVSLARQIALGLAAAHKQGLVHRDIKPANILLEKIDDQESGVRPLSTWHVKITDFGLARVAATSQLTSSGLIAGTPQYMSPEQANGHELDFRSDLFSLGSVMYAMSAGRAAFSAESAVAILRQVADMPALSLTEVSPETPDWLVAVIEKLMSKSPNDRIQSAAEVAEVLGRHELDLQNGITPSTSAAGSNNVPQLRRPRALVPVALAIIGVITAGVAMKLSDVPSGESLMGSSEQELKTAATILSDDFDTQVTVLDNTLTVTDMNGGRSDNNLSISFSGGNYTITDSSGLTLDAASIAGSSGSDTDTVTIPQSGIDAIHVITRAGNDTITVNSLDLNVSVAIDGGDDTDTVTWNNTSQISDVDLTADAILINTAIDSAGGDVNLTADAGINLATENSGITTSGTGDVSLTTTRDIIMASGSSITTADGDITLNANRQASQSLGPFRGILMEDSLVHATGSGNIIMNGRGAVGGISRCGISVIRSTVQTNTGSIKLNGIGSTNSGVQNNGVQVHGDAVVESTGGGSIDITGAAGTAGYGVRVLFNGVVRTTDTGAITLTGTGGAGTGPFNHGVAIDVGTTGNGAAVTNNGSGTITINATAGANAAAFFMGRGGTNRLGFDGTNAYLGHIIVRADWMDISDAIIQTTNTVNLRQKTGGMLTDPGGADAASQLGLTDAALGQISAGTLNIGNANQAPSPAIAPFDAEQANAHQVEWAKHIGVPVEYTNSIGMKFRLIPPGEFIMGATQTEMEEALPFAFDDNWIAVIRSEAPQHKVMLTQPFYLGVYEVTQVEYLQVMETNPSSFAAEGLFNDVVAGLLTTEFPVDSVSWHQAAEFCARLSQQEELAPACIRNGDTFEFASGTGYRLPTEAQWEFSCRAGTTTRFWIGDTNEDLGDVAWFLANSEHQTHPVGKLRSNPFGLYDMHGNVWEWVHDPVSPGIDPVTKDLANPPRILRGGLWANPAALGRSASRTLHDSVVNLNQTGFRVSLPVDAVTQALMSASSEKRSSSDGVQTATTDAP